MKLQLVGLLLAAMLGASVLASAVAAPEPAKDQPYQKVQGLGEVVTLNGTVKNYVQPENGKEVYFTLETDTDFARVVLARAVVLKFKGLTINNGDKVSVTGWQTVNANGVPGYVQAGLLTVAGKNCVLLSPKGMRTWTDTDVAPLITVEGTVKDLIAPEVPQPAPAVQTPKETPAPAANAPKPADTAKTAGDTTPPFSSTRQPKKMVEDISFTLVTDKETYKVVVGSAKFVTELGLVLTEAEKVKITGWMMGIKPSLMAKEMTVDGKDYILRGPDGKQATIAVPTPPAKAPAAQPGAPAVTQAPTVAPAPAK